MLILSHDWLNYKKIHNLNYRLHAHAQIPPTKPLRSRGTQTIAFLFQVGGEDVFMLYDVDVVNKTKFE
ncbi:hypothetical protein CWN84_06885 [Vibrio splendidus]|nr:hypothetical protein CWN84_06885 [Vibrio splendidus]